MSGRRLWVLILACALFSTTAAAQVAVNQVPPTIRVAGRVPDAQGAVVVTCAVYAEETSLAPLWTETQTVVADAGGRFTFALGATREEGLPTELFTSGEARWVGMQAAGQAEQPRFQLVSVPYALKAADATTIDGKPLSAFILAGDKTGVGPDGLTYVDKRVLASGLAAAASGAPGGAGSPGYIGVFTSPTELGNSVMYQSGTSIGISTTTPSANLHVVSTVAPAAFFDVVGTLEALPSVNRAARGTPGAPAAVQTNDILGGLAVRGYGATRYGGGVGQVMFKAAQPFTDTAQGTYLQMTTTPLNSNVWVERMRISPEGYVGVGSSAPAFPLEVRTNRGNTYARFGADHSPVFLIASQPMVGFNAYFDAGFKHGSTGPAGYLAFGQDGTGAFSFATAPSGLAGAAAAMTPRMVILNDGKVGIGTTSPADTLDVTGTANISGGLSAGSAHVTGSITVDGAVYGEWGNFGTSSAGFYALQGVSSGTGATVGVRGQVSSTTGKAFTGVVAGTEVMSADVDGIHAGPGMTGTPIAHGNFSNTGARRSGSSNISCAWAAASSSTSAPSRGELLLHRLHRDRHPHERAGGAADVQRGRAVDYLLPQPEWRPCRTLVWLRRGGVQAVTGFAAIGRGEHRSFPSPGAALIAGQIPRPRAAAPAPASHPSSRRPGLPPRR